MSKPQLVSETPKAPDLNVLLLALAQAATADSAPGWTTEEIALASGVSVRHTRRLLKALKLAGRLREGRRLMGTLDNRQVPVAVYWVDS